MGGKLMKIWVAGMPGGWSSERMTSTLSKLKIETFLFPLSECTLNLKTGVVSWEGEDLSGLDGIVVRKLGDSVDPLTPFRVNLLHQLSSRGVRVFSSPQAIEEANDRYRMSLKLSQAGVPIPETVVTESVDEAARVVERWEKAVLKPLFTSKGRGMLLLDSEEAYRLTLKHWQDEQKFPFYLQKYIPARYDIGVALLGKQILGAYQRVAPDHDAWQTTIRSGGHYEPFSPNSEVAEFACRAADPFGLDFTVVDIVPCGEEYLVYEVSAFGGFSGLWACGIDAASIYANYILVHLSIPKESLART
jgi:ribosomal protein S6--L-glutamate ligase